MKALIAAAAHHPVLANLLMAVILSGGTYCFTLMNREITPQFSADRIQVTVAFPGASPTEVEEGITVKIEEAVEGLAGIKNVDSVAREGIGTVVIELEDSVEDVSKVISDVRDRVDAIPSFPEDAEEPRVSEILLTNPAQLVVLHGQADERTLREVAMNIKDDLIAMPGLSQVRLSGVRDYEISIEVSEAKLRTYGLTLAQVAEAVRRGSLNLPGGTIRTRSEQFKIEVKGQRYRGKEYADLAVITRPDGTVVRLNQIAKIRDGFEQDASFGRFNGQPAVLILVMRTQDQDTISIAEQVKRYIAAQRQKFPEGLHLTTLMDFSKVVTGRIRLLTRNGLQGLGLVFLALFAFLNFRLSFWVALGIPVSFAFCGYVMLATGQSINMINLFGLILVLGIIVDDAIVIGENIHTYQRRGLSYEQAAVQGASEVAWPVVGTVTTTMVAFLPMFYVSGIMGKFIREIPVVVLATLLGSLFESLFILPNHLGHRSVLVQRLARLFRGADRRSAGARPFIRARFRGFMEGRITFLIERLYTPLYRKALQYRLTTVSLGFGALLLCGGLVAGGFVPFVIFPDADTEYVTAQVAFPEGTPIEVTERALARLESAALSLNRTLGRMSATGKLVQGVYSAAGGGTGKVHEGTIWVTLVGPEQRKINSEEILKAWREAAGPLPDVTSLTFKPLGGPAPRGADIEIFLLGRDLEQLRQAGFELVRTLKNYAGTYDVQSDFQPGKRELRVSLKPQGRALGITLQDLARQMRRGFYGAESLRLQRGRDEVKVQVRYPREERTSLEHLYRVRIRTPAGGEVPFEEVARVRLARGLAEIKRRNSRRRLAVRAEVDEARANANQILNEMQRRALPALREKFPGVEVSFEGPRSETRKSVTSLFRGFGYALIGIFAILALIFRSYLQPLLIMTTIPLGVVGAIAGHWLLGYQLNLLSLFGVVALAGVVVNDALVLIDRINDRQRRGAEVLDALHQAGPSRFRAIILTSLTTICGLTPLLMERSFQAQFLIPMAISLAAGLLFATLLTLFFVPSLYLLLNDLRRAVRWLATGAWPSREEVEPGCAEFRRRAAGGAGAEKHAGLKKENENNS